MQRKEDLFDEFGVDELDRQKARLVQALWRLMREQNLTPQRAARRLGLGPRAFDQINSAMVDDVSLGNLTHYVNALGGKVESC